MFAQNNNINKRKTFVNSENMDAKEILRHSEELTKAFTEQFGNIHKTSMEQFNKSFDKIEGKMDEIKKDISQNNEKIRSEINKSIAKVEENFDKKIEKLQENQDKQNEIIQNIKNSIDTETKLNSKLEEKTQKSLKSWGIIISGIMIAIKVIELVVSKMLVNNP